MSSLQLTRRRRDHEPDQSQQAHRQQVTVVVTRVLSLGAGVQSTTVLLLSKAGAIPQFDRIIFADTGDEPTAVYEHLDRLREVADIVTVSAGRSLSSTVNERFVPVPLYDGHGGMGRRQCTYQFKIRPIRSYLRQIGANNVDLSVCISTDEVERAKESGRQWIRNVHPLLEIGWSRADCQTYLAECWAWPVPRSACVYCPLKSDREWLEMRTNQPADWQRAIAFDESARSFGFVHRRGALSDVVLRPEDAGQLSLFGLECEGMCGV
jgi:3'-phosphoadenosine 5'-phosphosulfate sulfotransferase (PAPS reductase)/FAD synthetase